MVKSKTAHTRIGTLAILAFAGGIVLCSAAQAESLTEALAKAYSTNPQILSERAALRATDEGVSQALSNWRPSVTLSGEAGLEQVDSNTSQDTTQPRSVELSAVQPLFRGGRTVAETDRAEAEVSAGRAQLQAVEQSVLLNAVRAYMNVVRDLAVLELNRNNELRLARQLQAANDRFSVGEITRTDVSQGEARYARSTADRVQAEGAVINSRATYKAVVGDAPKDLNFPDVALDLPSNEDAVLAMATASNPEVVRATYRVASARHDIRLIRGELYPTLQLRGAIANEHETTASVANRDRDSAELMAQLSVPLYQSGSVYSRLRAAKETLAQRKEELDETRRATIESATSAWNQLQTARAARLSFEAEVRAGEIALEGVQREALVGSRTVLDVLDSEQELLDARVNLVRSQRDEVVARFELKAVVGAMTARDLELPVPYYDPTENYEDVRDQWFGADKPNIENIP